MRFLETRDYDFDVVKSFLVASMIIAHSFQLFYAPVYNKNLTYFVLFGFVFLSGLTVSGVYYEKFVTKPFIYAKVIVSRALKLFGIFLLANIAVLLMYPARFYQLRSVRLPEILLSTLLRDGQVHFSFQVLIAIGFTFLMSVIFLNFRNRSLDLLLLGLCISGLWAIDALSTLDYYMVKMTSVGFIGVLLGKSLGPLDWGGLRSVLSKWCFVIWGFYLMYQSILVAVNDEWHMYGGHYISVTILLLLSVYLTSYRFGLSNNAVLKLMRVSFAKHMLFAYLFHLFFLRTLSNTFGRGDFYFSTIIAFFTLCISMLACFTVDTLTQKYEKLSTLYSLVFR